MKDYIDKHVSRRALIKSFAAFGGAAVLSGCSSSGAMTVHLYQAILKMKQKHMWKKRYLEEHAEAIAKATAA